jgi:hypothetical protein
MAWGGFEDPAERKAAAEAADAANRRAAESDARTEALATAIVEGFGLVASAILTAAGVNGTHFPIPAHPLRAVPDPDEGEDLAALIGDRDPDDTEQ